MQPKIPPSLEERLQPHLQRMREGVGADDDVLPAVFAMLLERQLELEVVTDKAAVNLNSEIKRVTQALELATEKTAVNLNLGIKEITQALEIVKGKAAVDLNTGIKGVCAEKANKF